MLGFCTFRASLRDYVAAALPVVEPGNLCNGRKKNNKNIKSRRYNTV